MGLSAYAYFRTNEVTKSGVMHSADYLLDITVDNALLTGAQLTGSAGQEYAVKLSKNGSAQTGFCVITVRQQGAQDVVYHTQQIGTDRNVPTGKTEEITFKVHFNGDATLIFEPHWGTSSNYAYVDYEQINAESQENTYIINGETLTVAANPQSQQSPPPSNEGTTTTVTTTVTVTTTTTTAAGETSSTVSSSSTSTSASSSTQETTETTAASTSVANTTANGEN